MNNNQKQAIQELRSRGNSYSQIADEVGLSANTIKSFCHRCDVSKNLCKNCRRPLISIAKHKPKTFCNDACRQMWWRMNRSQMKMNAVKRYICANCNQPFDGYGSRNRKYCCRGCYIAHRYGVP